MLEVRITGIEELRARLRELPRDLAEKSLAGACSAAAAVVRKDARAAVERLFYQSNVTAGGKRKGRPNTGTLRRAVYQGKAKEQPTLGGLAVRYIVGVRSGKRYRKVGKRQVSQDAFYWRFLEFGTSTSPARPFLRPAFERNKMAMIDAFKRRLATRIRNYQARR